MTTRTQQIVDAAVRLPPRQRLRIVEELLASLEPHAQEEIDSAWAAEIERRSRDVKEGSVQLLPWTRVKSRARRRIRAKK